MTHARFLPILIALTFATEAAAQNASTAGALSLYATYHNVGARLAYTGDANGNATARIEWRATGSSAWTPGVSMTRITNSRWAGSVLWLQPGTSYEVRATIDDPDGGGSATAAVQTRTDPVTLATGRTWWVAVNGSDANDGSSGSPLATIQSACDRVAPGDEVRVRPGVYYQTLDVTRGGTANAPVHLVADAPGVILDGADPAYLQRTDWRNDGGGIWSVPYTGTTKLVAADSLQRLYRHASLADLQGNANGVPQGWYADGARLSVKLEDGSSPQGHRMYVARYNQGVYLDAPYWRVAGFEIRHYAVTTGGCGIRIRATNGSVIQDNHIHTNGGRGVFLNALAWDNLIERNLCRDPRIGTWPWDAVKSHEEEFAGIAIRAGRGNVIRQNVVSGTFDGMDCGDGTTDETVAADCDYYENVVTGCGDDGIETDIVSGINLRVYRNHFDNLFSGFSIAPIYQGPEYVLYNTITNYRRSGFKFSLSGTGVAWICHNTVTSAVSGTPAVKPAGPYSNLHFRNNILVGRGIEAVNDETGESQTGNSYDGDLLWAISSSRLFLWKSVGYNTLAALRTGTGFELAGRQGDPLFANAAAGDYTLQASSPAIDGAIRMSGINDFFSGAGPDMGAFELGGVDVTAPARITDLR